MIELKNVFKYLDNNCSKDKEYLIEKIISIFKYTKEIAKKIYYQWKSHFMKARKCIPNSAGVKLAPKFKVRGNMVIGEYGEYKVLDGCIVVGYHFFNTIQEIEKYRFFRVCSKLKSMDNILDEAIEVMRIKSVILNI